MGLRGGHRFYATPYSIGSAVWLKVDNDDIAPPLFSPAGAGARAPGGDQKKMYTECVPALWHHHPDMGMAEETWVRNETSCISFIRHGRPDSIARSKSSTGFNTSMG